MGDGGRTRARLIEVVLKAEICNEQCWQPFLRLFRELVGLKGLHAPITHMTLEKFFDRSTSLFTEAECLLRIDTPMTPSKLKSPTVRIGLGYGVVAPSQMDRPNITHEQKHMAARKILFLFHMDDREYGGSLFWCCLRREGWIWKHRSLGGPGGTMEAQTVMVLSRKT